MARRVKKTSALTRRSTREARSPTERQASSVRTDSPASWHGAEYTQLLEDVKACIRAAQTKAVLAVNRELIELYWRIGQSIVERQKQEGWGNAIVERLANDIEHVFPGISGFSRQNIWKMRALYIAWTEEIQNLSQPVRELDGKSLPQAVREIPWGHNTELIFKLKNPIQRLWYAQQTAIQGWSRAVLIHQVESDLYHRSGKAVTNFASRLPPVDSDLVQQLLKDPYNFDFLTLPAEIRERDLERSLMEHLKNFLLELGVGFAFVGQQHRIEIGGEEFYLDLVFYHLQLRRYIVIDLKVEDFKPEFAGKMNFYLSAIDDQLRHGDDQPSIGLILCKTQNRLIAEYALRDTSKPMGVATYSINLPETLQGSLPSPQQLIDELDRSPSDTKNP